MPVQLQRCPTGDLPLTAQHPQSAHELTQGCSAYWLQHSLCGAVCTPSAPAATPPLHTLLLAVSSAAASLPKRCMARHREKCIKCAVRSHTKRHACVLQKSVAHSCVALTFKISPIHILPVSTGAAAWARFFFGFRVAVQHTGVPVFGNVSFLSAIMPSWSRY